MNRFFFVLVYRELYLTGNILLLLFFFFPCLVYLKLHFYYRIVFFLNSIIYFVSEAKRGQTSCRSLASPHANKYSKIERKSIKKKQEESWKEEWNVTECYLLTWKVNTRKRFCEERWLACVIIICVLLCSENSLNTIMV